MLKEESGRAFGALVDGEAEASGALGVAILALVSLFIRIKSFRAGLDAGGCIRGGGVE